MKKFTFEYKDEYTHGKFKTQTGICKDLAHLIEWYGLDKPDVEYRILSVEAV